MKSESTQTLACCNSHQDYLVPLIPTFRFSGSEYWCPFCGRKYGLFDKLVEVHQSEELIKRFGQYDAISESYLSGKTKEYKLNVKPNESNI